MSTIDSKGNRHLGAGMPGAGEFTRKLNAPPTATLAPPASAVAPVKSVVRLQRWTGPRNDQIIEVESLRLDVAAALDTLPLDDVRSFGDTADNDPLFETLREHGLVQHNGPFDVELDRDELDEYISEREIEDRELPLRATVLRDLEDVRKALSQVSRDAQKLADRKHQLQAQYVAAAVAAEVPAARAAVVNPHAFPYLFDSNDQRIMIDDEVAERLRIQLDAQRISGTFEL